MTNWIDRKMETPRGTIQIVALYTLLMAALALFNASTNRWTAMMWIPVNVFCGAFVGYACGRLNGEREERARAEKRSRR